MSGVMRGLQDTSNRNPTLLEDLQITVKPTLLRDLVHCYNDYRVTMISTYC